MQRFPVLWPHILQTLATTMIGFALGVALGVVLGAVIGVSRTAYDTVYPLLIGFSSIPKVAVVPIFVLWFGSGTVPAVLTSLSICFFPIVVNIATGLATTEPEMEDVLKALGASKFDILWNVGLPRTMPFFFASLKVAITYAFVGTVLAETVASNRGIGNVMMIGLVQLQRAAGLRRAVHPRRARRRALRRLLADREARHRLGHPQERFRRRLNPTHQSTRGDHDAEETRCDASSPASLSPAPRWRRRPRSSSPWAGRRKAPMPPSSSRATRATTRPKG